MQSLEKDFVISKEIPVIHTEPEEDLGFITPDESIIKDGYPTLKKACKCYRFWYNDLLMGE